MTGQSIYKHSFDTPTVLLIGNEGRELVKTACRTLKQTLSIPRFEIAESLNAAMATGIILAEARRITLLKNKINKPLCLETQ